MKERTMASEVYTAQEMREAANKVGSVHISEYLYYINQVQEQESTRRAAAMLRQAAEMRERLDELLLTFHSCPDERDLLNYILRGDAGKDERCA